MDISTKFFDNENKEHIKPGTQDHLQSFFLKSAAHFPDFPCLAMGNTKWTYAEIENEARRWASALLDGCSGLPQRVGVLAARDKIAYVGPLACLFAGATYVPLNPMFPLQRTLSIIKQADLDAIIVDEQSLGLLTSVLQLLPSIPFLLLPESNTSTLGLAEHVIDRTALSTMKPLLELPTVSLDSIAYLLFTSGSTGQPKGVPITHKNVSHFLSWNLDKYHFTPDDRFSQTFDQTFDLSIFDLFMAWGSGACLCAVQPIELLAPFQYIREQKITVWFSVPSLIALLRKKRMLTTGSLATLRWSLFCGEALPQAFVEDWQKAAPFSIIENLYGPTELTIACAAYRWDPLNSPDQCVNGIVPIGQIYDQLHCVIVNEQQRPVREGQEGELCVAGVQTFQGYWRDSEKTAERFFSIGGSELRYFRTGDLVRQENGYCIYLGRIDRQVKIRGYRVELGEIEAVLRKDERVVEAAALGWPLEDGKAQGIVAFVSGEHMQASELLEVVRSHVPAYMSPSQIYILDNLPHNINGKIDYNVLYSLLEIKGGNVER